jgi:hypothetical protein
VRENTANHREKDTKMPTIHRLEANDPKHGGVLVTWDDNTSKVASWTSSTHVDVRQVAKHAVEGVIQNLLDNDRQDLLGSTNWVSVTACVAKHVADWNDVIVRRVGREVVGRVS